MSQLNTGSSSQASYELYLQGLIFDSIQSRDFEGLNILLDEIGHSREIQAVPALIRFLDDGLTATDSLASIAYPQVVQVLGALGDDRAVPVLVRLVEANIDFWFDEEVEDILEPAVIVLSKLGRPGLLALARMFTEKHPGFQHWVSYALNGKEIISQNSSPVITRKAPVDQLTKRYIACLDEPDPLTRLGVVKVLNELKNTEAVEPLMTLLDTESSFEVKAEIIATLGNLAEKYPSVSKFLVELRQSGENDDRYNIQVK